MFGQRLSTCTAQKTGIVGAVEFNAGSLGSQLAAKKELLKIQTNQSCFWSVIVWFVSLLLFTCLLVFWLCCSFVCLYFCCIGGGGTFCVFWASAFLPATCFPNPILFVSFFSDVSFLLLFICLKVAVLLCFNWCILTVYWLSALCGPFGLTIKVLKVLRRHQRALFKVQMETHLDQFQMLMILNTPTDKYYGLGGSKRCLGFYFWHQVMFDELSVIGSASAPALLLPRSITSRQRGFEHWRSFPKTAPQIRKKVRLDATTMVGLLLDALVFPIVVSKNVNLEKNGISWYQLYWSNQRFCISLIPIPSCLASPLHPVNNSTWS